MISMDMAIQNNHYTFKLRSNTGHKTEDKLFKYHNSSLLLEYLE